jgi:hypothetical protein
LICCGVKIETKLLLWQRPQRTVSIIWETLVTG